MLEKLIYELLCWVDAIVGQVPGRVGNRLRRAWYSTRAAKVGERLGTEPGIQMSGLSGISIGDDASFGGGCKLSATNGALKLGNRVKANSGVTLNADFSSIEIGDDVLIAMSVIMRAADHRFDRSPEVLINQQGHEAKAIQIGNDVWIGAGAIILPGAIIGDHCVIGAGAVVKGEIPPNSVAVGVPARVIKQLGP